MPSKHFATIQSHPLASFQQALPNDNRSWWSHHHLFGIADGTRLLQLNTYFASRSVNRGSLGFTTVAVSSAALSSAFRVVNTRGVLHLKSWYSPMPCSAANRDSSPKR